MSWAVGGVQLGHCPRQGYERNRQRIVAQDDFARRLAQETKAFRAVEYENRTEQRCQARRLAGPAPTAAGALDPEERLERIAQHKQAEAAAREQEARAWEAELARTAETPEQRRAQLQAHAWALKEKNEAARQAFVQECYDKQWRDACDDARLLDGQALEAFMAQERVRQVREKAERHAQALAEEATLLAKLRAHEQALEAAQASREARRAAQQKATIATLQGQIAAARAARAAARAREAEEDARELAAAAEKEKVEAEKEEARKREAVQRGEQIRAANAQRLGRQQAAAAEERAQDLALLEHALAVERASEGREQAKRAAQAAEARAYQACLRAQMQKDAEDDEAIVHARSEMEQHVWEQRDTALRRQEAARAALLAQVRAANEEQMQRRALAQLEDAKLEATQLEHWQAEQAQALAEEEAQAAVRREAVRRHEAALRQQVEERRARAALERQQEYLQRKHLLKAEAEHVARLKAQAGRVRVHHPLSSSGQPWAS